MKKVTTQKATYTIETTDHWRMAGGVLEGCPMYRKTYKHYSIFLNGELITFVHDENEIEQAIRHYEWAQANPAAAAKIGSRFD